MSEIPSNRRLAAILAADVVGYSRLMGADETGTLAALKRHREVLFNPAVERHNGRVFKLIGDGTLVEFASVVDAVNCALAIQTAAEAENVANGDGPAIVLRIGVNLGDIIMDGDDVYGDGVNVAARLEPLAEPGGICVASIVNESVGNRIDVAFRDGGEVSVKNIQRPIRVWKWHPKDAVPTPTPAASPPPTQATPQEAVRALAVLPFDNMSGDPEQEYFSDGMTEDLITDLSKVAGLLVIARNSSFAYKGKSPDIRTVGRELGVTSVLEGSIRRAGNRVRINAQLIDATTGGHVWAERYDRDLTDIFEVQDEVTRNIVEALRVALSPAEEKRIADTPTDNVEAHDSFLRAREIWSNPNKTREIFDAAQAQFERAIELDPNYGEAYAGLAMTYNLDFLNRWSGRGDQSLADAVRYADMAIDKSPDSAYAHYVRSVTAGFTRDPDRTAREIAIALRLSPNFAQAVSAQGAFCLFSGHPEDAIPHFEHAIRLEPTNRPFHFLGLAHLLMGKYETAVAEFRERILEFPETDISRSYLASALGHLGEIEEARRVWAELKRINPQYSFEAHVGRLPFQRESDVSRIRDGLAKAGLPD